MMLSDVCRLYPVDGQREQPAAGWCILADQAQLGQPGSRLPLHTSIAGLGGAYRGGNPPTACYVFEMHNK